ncbi:MAG: hypothetical protein PHE25_00800 [Candidatus Gracilibacteria bacterium]|nr:hypothetical protein [Candidatus Gracilibacteria bacterium]
MALSENPEGKETKEAANQSKFDNKPNLNRQLDDFCLRNFESDETKFREDLKKFQSGNPETYEEFKTYIRQTSPELFGYVESEEGKKDFQNSISSKSNKLFIKADIKRRNLLGAFNNEYTLNPEQTKRIEDELAKKNIKELDKLKSKSNLRKKFVDIVFSKDPNNKPTIKDIDKVLNQLKADVNFNNLTSDQKEAFARLANPRLEVLLSDVEVIIPLLLTPKQKKAFIALFLPIVSLKQLVDWGIYKESEIVQAIDEEFKNRLETEYGIPKTDLLKYVGKGLFLNLEDIEISTQNLDRLDSEEHLDKLLGEEGIQNFVNDLKEFRKETSEDYKKSGPKGIEEFRKLLPTSKVNGVENFDKNGYIVLEYRDVINGKEVKQKKVLRIDNTFDHEFSYSLVSNGGIVSPKSSNTGATNYSYKEFLDLVNDNGFTSMSCFDYNGLLGYVSKQEDLSINQDDFGLSDSQGVRDKRDKLNADLLTIKERLKAENPTLTDAEIETLEEYTNLKSEVDKVEEEAGNLEEDDLASLIKELVGEFLKNKKFEISKVIV